MFRRAPPWCTISRSAPSRCQHHICAGWQRGINRKPSSRVPFPGSALFLGVIVKLVVKPPGEPPEMHTGRTLEISLDGRGSPLVAGSGPLVDRAVALVALPVPSDHGGATTTGPDATYPPAICQNSGGGGGGGGGGGLGVDLGGVGWGV